MTDYKPGEALYRATRHTECHEDVTRQGESQPCNKVSVAVRCDPEGGEPYPVCAYHASRGGMVPLVALSNACLAARSQR